MAPCLTPDELESAAGGQVPPACRSVGVGLGCLLCPGVLGGSVDRVSAKAGARPLSYSSLLTFLRVPTIVAFLAFFATTSSSSAVTQGLSWLVVQGHPMGQGSAEAG